jgi:hypothetical protein
MLMTCVYLAVLAYFFTIRFVGDSFHLPSNYYLIVIYMAVAVAYYLQKIIIYTVVHSTFFGGKRNLQWLKSFLFMSSLEGVLLFPGVIAVSYLNIKEENILIYLGIVLIIVKLLSIYKTYLIFFRTNVLKLQIILYFCTLEIIPMLMLVGSVLMLAENLKINI